MAQISTVFYTYLRRVIVPALVSLIISYTVYAWVLQTPYFFSRSRLAIAMLIWAAITFLLSFFRIDLAGLLRQPWRKFLPGIGSLFIIFNLVISIYLAKIPYTYLFLPKQSVIVQPLTFDDDIEIVSFVTENEGLQKIKRFVPTEHWEGLGERITHIPGTKAALTWSGKPGQTVEIQFKTCPTCGVVEVQSSGESDRFDLTQNGPDGVAVYKKQYGSLVFHKVANLVMLEIAALLTATLLLMVARHLIESLSRKRSSRFPSFALPAKWENAAVFGSLAALTAINYDANLQSILYNDDWCQIVYDAHAGNLSLFMLNSRRPLHLFFAALYNNFLSIDQLVFALYVTQSVVLALTAYLIYRFVREGFDAPAGLGLLSAALWLVYPNDYTYIYLIMLAARTALLLSVAYFLLILRIIRNGSWSAVAAALAATVLGLLMYEGQLGIIIAGPVILALIKRKQLTRKKIAAIAVSYTGTAAFIIWRIFFQPLFYQDTKLAALEIQPRELVSQWLLTVKTLFGGFRFPAGNTGWLSLESRWIVLLLVVGIILITALFFTLPATLGKKSPLIQVAAGALLWTAGYFPILLNYPVNIYSHLSRVNLFANLGAALLVIGLLHTLTTSLGSARATNKLLLVLTLPLLFIASLVQLQVQEANRQSWDEAKIFYTRLIGLVPDIKPETQVLFTISVAEPAGPIRRPLFTSTWEAECAVWSLYGTTRPNLLVGFKYDDIYVPPFPGYNILAGALARNSNDDIPDTSKLVVLNYDMVTTVLEVTQDIGFLDVESPQAYHPEDRILPITRDIPARKLVAPE